MKEPEQNIQKRKQREHEENLIQIEPRHKKTHSFAGKGQEATGSPTVIHSTEACLRRCGK
jgi:hypothetical protein